MTTSAPMNHRGYASNHNMYHAKTYTQYRVVLTLILVDFRFIVQEHAGFIITLHLKRRSFYYVFNVIVPILVLVSLNLANVRTSSRARDEKMILGLSVTIAQSWYLLVVAPGMRASGDALPLIGEHCSYHHQSVILLHAAVLSQNACSFNTLLYCCMHRIAVKQRLFQAYRQHLSKAYLSI